MKNLFIAALILSAFFSQAQFPVGHYMDSQGMPIVGYFDPLEYENGNGLSEHVDLDKFRRGYYYDRNHKKKHGWIYQRPSRILYKESEESLKVQKIMARNAPAVVIGTDSFFVENRFQIQRGSNEESYLSNPQYLQYITSFDSTDFVQFRFEIGNASSHYYLSRRKGDAMWNELPKTKNDQLERLQMIALVMVKVPNFGDKNLDQKEQLKLMEALFKSKSNEPLYYDQYWNEINDPNKAFYNAYVSTDSSSWTFHYYWNNKLFQEIRYKKLFPEERDGIARWFYDNGNVRKEVLYENGKATHIKNYFENGALHYHFRKQYNEPVTIQAIEFQNNQALLIEVGNESGESVLDSEGNGTEKFYDSHNDREIVREIKQGKIVSSYAILKNDKKIYQWSDGEHKVIRLKHKWKYWEYLLDDFQEILEREGTGMVLNKLIINEKGEFIDQVEIYSVDENLTQQVNKFYTLFSPVATLNKMKKLKVAGEDVVYEMVVPFNFTFSYFTRERYYNNYWNHNMFFNQHFYMYQPPIIVTPPQF